MIPKIFFNSIRPLTPPRSTSMTLPQKRLLMRHRLAEALVRTIGCHITRLGSYATAMTSSLKPSLLRRVLSSAFLKNLLGVFFVPERSGIY